MAFIYHPDKGGDTVLMQILNDSYERLSEKFIKENDQFSEGRKEYEMQVSEEIRMMLDRIMFLKGVEIEVHRRMDLDNRKYVCCEDNIEKPGIHVQPSKNSVVLAQRRIPKEKREDSIHG